MTSFFSLCVHPLKKLEGNWRVIDETSAYDVDVDDVTESQQRRLMLVVSPVSLSDVTEFQQRELMFVVFPASLSDVPGSSHGVWRPWFHLQCGDVTVSQAGIDWRRCLKSTLLFVTSLFHNPALIDVTVSQSYVDWRHWSKSAVLFEELLSHAAVESLFNFNVQQFPRRFVSKTQKMWNLPKFGKWRNLKEI